MLFPVPVELIAAAPKRIGPAGFTASQPQIAAQGRRAFVACGMDDRVYVLASRDGARSFGSPILLPSRGHLSLGMRRGPRIAVAGKTLVVSAVVGARGGGRDGDLLAWRSVNEGRSWAGPSRVSDAPGAAREGLHAMAASNPGDRIGRLACAWLDLRNPGTEVWAATSTDGGATWSENVRVYRSPAGNVCECCHPSVAFGPKGELHVMFRNWLGGSRDMYLATSRDGGRTFGAAAKLGRGTWPLNACPMDGGAIDVAPDGTVTTAWRRGPSVFVARPGRAEVQLGSGEQPWTVTSPKGTFTVWERDGRILASSGGTPQALGMGRWPDATLVEGRGVAVWSDDAGTMWCGRI